MRFGPFNGGPRPPQPEQTIIKKAPQDIKIDIERLPDGDRKKALGKLVHQIEGTGSGMRMRDEVEAALNAPYDANELPEEREARIAALEIYGRVNTWESIISPS